MVSWGSLPLDPALQFFSWLSSDSLSSPSPFLFAKTQASVFTFFSLFVTGARLALFCVWGFFWLPHYRFVYYRLDLYFYLLPSTLAGFTDPRPGAYVWGGYGYGRMLCPWNKSWPLLSPLAVVALLCLLSKNSSLSQLAPKQTYCGLLRPGPLPRSPCWLWVGPKHVMWFGL